MKRISMLLATLAILLLAFGSVSAQGWSGGSIGVDKVQGLSGLDTINIGSDLRFILRYRNDTTAKFGISNGFRVYSPDGATWDSTTGDTLGWRASDPSPGVPILGGTQFDLGLTLGRYSNDGAESDTIGVLGLMFTGAGLAGGFNDTAFAVTAYRMHAASHGKHICVDSSWFRPGGTWKWARTGGVNRFPAWSGGKCYTIYNPSAPPSDTISVTPTFLSFTEAAGNGAAIEQDITVSDKNGHAYAFTATLLHLPGWVSLPISSGTTTGIVRVSVNAGALASGTYYDTVAIMASAVGSPVLVPITFVVTPALQITKLALKDWTANYPGYSEILTATGGTLPYTWSIISGALPTGLTLNPATGEISGTPTVNNVFSFTAQVADAVPSTATHAYTITINQAPIVLSSCFGQWTEGLAITPTQMDAGAGTGTKHWSITSGALPTGIALTSSGMVSGTPTAAGTFPYTITATDSIGATGSLACSWIVNPAIAIGNCPSDGVKDVPYSASLASTGGTGSVTWALAFGSGALPTGLSLSPAGAIAGTPSAAGSFNVTFEATDAVGAKATKACTMTVVDGLSITTACPSDWTVGMAFLHQFTAVGGVGTKTFSISAGSLPSGTSMNGDGLITGAPSAAGTFNFIVQVTDGASNTANKACSWIVNDVPAITTACPAPTYVGKSVSLQFVATGGTGALTWSISAGNLPDGVTLSPTGLLAGTPAATEFGLFLYTIKVIDATGASGTQACQWTVLRMPAVTSSCPPNGTVGVHFTTADTATGGVAPYSWSLISGALPAGMTYNAAGVLDGTPTESGSFTFTVQVKDNNNEIGTKTCTWVVGACKSIFVRDSLLVFDASEGDVSTVPSMIMDSIMISGGGSAVVYVRAPLDTTWVKFTHGADTATTLTVTAPAVIGVMVNPAGKSAGNYFADCIVWSVDPSICDPKMVVFTTEMKIKKVILPSTDTVIVSTVPAVPGMELDVPVTLRNSCNLDSMMASFSFDPAHLHLAGVSFAGSRLTGSLNSSVNNAAGTWQMWGSATGALPLASPGRGLMATLHFIVKPDAPAGFYPVVKLVDAQLYRNCGTGPTAETPEFIPGGIIVDPNLMNSICGYVVDEFGVSISGATVELYGNYPGAPLATVGSSAIGSFFINGNFPVPFDLRAHMSGYYPGFVMDLNFNAKGVKIVLKRLRSVVITSQWVDYYCNSNTLDGILLPLGSVIEATTPTGLLVGQWIVTEVGKYGYMPVYRANPDLLDPNGAVTGQAIAFSVDGNPATTTGNTIYPGTYDQMQVCLVAESNKTKECTLVAGWNLVSWNVDTKTDSIEAVLASLAGRISVVLGFEGGGLTFDPALKQFSTLWFTDHLSGYWIKITDGPSITLRVTGMAVAPSTAIPVTAGWNLVSYLPDASLPTADALASLGSNLILAYGYDNGVKFYMQGSACGGPTCLATMDPCHGYWVKVLQNGSLTYPGGIPGAPIFASENPNIVAARLAAPSDITPSLNWVNMYGGNLTLNGERVAAGTKIGAVTLSGTKVGSFTMTESGKFGFMPVYAQTTNDGSADGLQAGDQFRLTVNGVETEQTFTWTANGDRVEVSALSAKTTGGTIPGSYSLSQNYPNPFNPSTTISFTLPAAGQARLEVIDILGRHVATVFDGTANAGQNQVVWDGRNANGESVASGIYLYRLNSGNFTESKKMMLLK